MSHPPALLQLPKAFRQELRDAGVVTGRSTLYSSSNSADGTRKFLCQLSDGHVVETVGIPFDAEHGQRLTACISSQARAPLLLINHAPTCSACVLVPIFLDLIHSRPVGIAVHGVSARRVATGAV